MRGRGCWWSRRFRNPDAEMSEGLRRLRILLLEDDPLDAELIQATLAEGGIPCQTTLVETRDGFVAALESGHYDLIVSDYSLPAFDGLSALSIACETHPQVPFIFVSGAVGEERAIESLKEGATDYVLKHRLERLVPVVRRAVREGEERAELERAERELRRAEARYRSLVEQLPAVTYIESLGFGERTTDLTYASPRIEDMFGYSPEEWTADPDLFVELVHLEDRERVLAENERAKRTGEPFRVEYRQFTRDGRILWVRNEATLVRDDDGVPLYWQGILVDVSEQKRVEAELRTQNEYLASLQETMLGLLERLEPANLLRGILERAGALVGTPHGYIYLFDPGDGRLEVRVGAGLFERYIGYRISPGEGLAGRVFESGEPLAVDDYAAWANRLYFGPDTIHAVVGVPLRAGGRVTGVLALSYTGEERKFGEQEIGLLTRFADLGAVALENARLFEEARRELTARRQAERELAELVEELRRSNAELEQFAYVASHDLQEPLRMVSSYTQLLARRYRGRLDEDADEFIAYAVDGARRMQVLINDLLAYSRVGTRGKDLVPTDTAGVVEVALANIGNAIEDSGARVSVTSELPVVMGDQTQLVQLFQNLISNAVKFHAGEEPRVEIAASRRDREWLFSVADNGIGIDARYAERIFVIFQRLHRNTEYPGTGIGLAVCKKIVERHGGRIWVESQPGEGSTFFFTLRAAVEGENSG